MLTDKDIQEVLQQPWWTTVKNEVARTIAIRTKAEDPSLRPHGSLLGQMYIELLNKVPELRTYVHYLLTRKWPELLEVLKGDLSPQMRKALEHEQGAEWFMEFQRFLARAWKRSSGQTDDPLQVFDSGIFMTIRNEWLLHVRRKASPGALAGIMVEWMRNAENDLLRRGAMNAYAFITVRSWKEVLDALRTHDIVSDPVQDLADLDTPEAEAFYDNWKAMVMASVGEYWDSLLNPAEGA